MLNYNYLRSNTQLGPEKFIGSYQSSPSHYQYLQNVIRFVPLPVSLIKYILNYLLSFKYLSYIANFISLYSLQIPIEGQTWSTFHNLRYHFETFYDEELYRYDPTIFVI